MSARHARDAAGRALPHQQRQLPFEADIEAGGRAMLGSARRKRQTRPAALSLAATLFAQLAKGRHQRHGHAAAGLGAVAHLRNA